MKRIYAIILFVSFITGTMQPVMPMIFFSINGGELIEIVAPGFFESPFNSKEQYCSAELNLFEDSEENEIQSLLDTEYYPLPVNLDNESYHTFFDPIFTGYCIIKQDTLDVYLFSGTPPPRII